MGVILSRLFYFALLGGADNLQACLGIGLLPFGRRQRQAYAIAFSAAEVIASALGPAIGSRLRAPWILLAERYPPVVLLLFGAAILGLAVNKRDLTRWFGNPWMILGVPLLFSVDNFLMGAESSVAEAAPWFFAVVNGSTGAAMSCGGLYLGIWVRRMRPRLPDFIAGGYLLLLSLKLWIRG